MNGLVNNRLTNSYRGEKVSVYQDVLIILRDQNLELDLDLWIPHQTHPYYDSYFEIVLNETQAVGFDFSKILLPSNKIGFYPDGLDTQWLTS